MICFYILFFSALPTGLTNSNFVVLQNSQNYSSLVPTCDKLKDKIETQRAKEDDLVFKLSQVKINIVTASRQTHMLEVRYSTTYYMTLIM